MISNDGYCEYFNIWMELTRQSHIPNSAIFGSNRVFTLLDDTDRHFIQILVQNHKITVEGGHTYIGQDSIEYFLSWLGGIQI